MPLSSLAIPITAVLASVSAIVAQVPAVPESVQYGAMGLCGTMVVLNWWSYRDMGKRLDQDRQKIVELHTKTLSALGRMCEAMEDRPCLTGDQRVTTYRHDHERDLARDFDRDQSRDKTRDQARDGARDVPRDQARDYSHDKPDAEQG